MSFIEYANFEKKWKNEQKRLNRKEMMEELARDFVGGLVLFAGLLAYVITMFCF